MWCVVRGHIYVEQLEQEWENIATHTGWKLQTVFHFDAGDVPTPQSSDMPTTPTSDEQVSGTQPIVPCISSHNGDAVEPVQSLAVDDNLSMSPVGSGGETINPSNHDNGPDCIHITTPTPVSVQTFESPSPMLASDSSSPLQYSSIPSSEYNTPATHQN